MPKNKYQYKTKNAAIAVFTDIQNCTNVYMSLLRFRLPIALNAHHSDRRRYCHVLLIWHCRKGYLKGSVKEQNKFRNYETEKITRKASDVAEYIELFGSSTRDRHA